MWCGHGLASYTEQKGCLSPPESPPAIRQDDGNRKLSFDEHHSKNCGQESSRAAKISLGKPEKKWGLGRVPSCAVTSYKERSFQQQRSPAGATSQQRSRSPTPAAAQSSTASPVCQAALSPHMVSPLSLPQMLNTESNQEPARLRALFNFTDQTFFWNVTRTGGCASCREGHLDSPLLLGPEPPQASIACTLTTLYPGFLSYLFQLYLCLCSPRPWWETGPKVCGGEKFCSWRVIQFICKMKCGETLIYYKQFLSLIMCTMCRF